MNLRPALPLLFAGLATPICFGASMSLVNNIFEAPTDRTVIYPPAKGEKFQTIAPGLSGWASEGSMQMSYAKGLGLDGSGGIQAKILKEAKFAQITYSKLDFTAFRDDFKLRDVVRSIRLEFDANIPAGKDFGVYVQAEAPRSLGLIESVWTSRLVLGKVVGQGSYAHYSFSGAAVEEEGVVSFINYVRSLYLNGVTPLTGSMNFHLDSSQWPESSEFTFDNVRMTVESN